MLTRCASCHELTATFAEHPLVKQWCGCCGRRFTGDEPTMMPPAFVTYESKPVRVLAFRYDGQHETLRLDDHMRTIQDPLCDGKLLLQVCTISQQWVTVREGDYVVKDRHGQGYYPCDPAYFEQCYTPLTGHATSDQRQFPTVADELAYLKARRDALGLRE